MRSFLSILCAVAPRRARRTAGRVSAAVVAVVLLAGVPAQAYFGQMTLSMKAGPYVPAIDNEVVDGQKVYPVYRCFFQGANTFPPGGLLPLPEIDADWHLFDLFGSLEFGVGLAATQARGFARAQTDYNQGEIAAGRCGDAGEESVELSLLFVKPRLSYRFDVLHDYLGIPLVPYARVGLVGACYFFSRYGSWDQQPFVNDDDVNTRGNLNPLGARLGYEVGGGMMFGLDWVDLTRWWKILNRIPKNYRTEGLNLFRWDTGTETKSSVLDNAYIFVEGVYSEIDSFRQPGLILSPASYLFVGTFPVLFNVGFAVELQ